MFRSLKSRILKAMENDRAYSVSELYKIAYGTTASYFDYDYFYNTVLLELAINNKIKINMLTATYEIRKVVK